MVQYLFGNFFSRGRETFHSLVLLKKWDNGIILCASLDKKGATCK